MTGLSIVVICLIAIVALGHRRNLSLPKVDTPVKVEDGPIGPGTLVGSYRLLRRVGEGAVAEVFLGENSSGDKAAIKILLPHANDSEEFRTRFEREICLSMELDHPRIVKTYDWGLIEGRYWMAQTYLPGNTLQSWVKPSGMHAGDVRKVMIQICEGLEHLHEKGVFHRDLKPENILLNAKGEPVLADFGMARGQMYASITHVKAVVGTPAFMAPEQAQGHSIDGRADLYALGIIGYELLTGILPFRGKPVNVLIAHVQEQPTPPREIQPNVPDEYQAVILKLMEKNPDDRYQSARDVITALEAIRAGSE